MCTSPNRNRNYVVAAVSIEKINCEWRIERTKTETKKLKVANGGEQQLNHLLLWHNALIIYNYYLWTREHWIAEEQYLNPIKIKSERIVRWMLEMRWPSLLLLSLFFRDEQNTIFNLIIFLRSFAFSSWSCCFRDLGPLRGHITSRNINLQIHQEMKYDVDDAGHNEWWKKEEMPIRW